MDSISTEPVASGTTHRQASTQEPELGIPVILALKPIQPFRFLDLPFELRQQVYQQTLLQGARKVTIDRNEFSPKTESQMFRVSRQVYQESRSMFYSQKAFTMCRELDSRDAWSVLNSIGDVNLSMIRDLQITRYLYVRQMDEPKFSAADVIWQTINLRVLSKLEGLEKVKLCFVYQTGMLGGLCGGGNYGMIFPGCCEKHEDQNKLVRSLCVYAAFDLVGASNRLNHVVNIRTNSADQQTGSGGRRSVHQVKVLRTLH